MTETQSSELEMARLPFLGDHGFSPSFLPLSNCSPSFTYLVVDDPLTCNSSCGASEWQGFFPIFHFFLSLQLVEWMPL